MLTIKNILKLQNQPIWDGWDVTLIYEGNQNDTYVFELANHRQSTTKRCKIMLERTGHKIFGQPGFSYFFIYNSMRTNISASADWLADKDNMIAKLEYILVNKEKL